MNGVVRRLLLPLLLAPLVGAIVLALLNPRPAVALRLLTWTSPALPIGSWLALAVGGGGLLSAAATTAGLQSSTPLRRRVRQPPGSAWAEKGSPSGSSQPPAAPSAPQRPPGDPPPTVEVPFRVIRRGSGAAAPATREPGPAPVATAVGDGWSDGGSEDW